jgi:ribosomal protein S18 acetylase RimI-like enzyme
MAEQAMVSRALDVDGTATLLARAFQDDPMVAFLVGDPARTLTHPMPLYRASVRLAERYGVVQVSAARDAVAIWVRPGATDFSFGQMRRTGLLTAVLRMGPTTMRRFMRAQPLTERLERASISGPHWYLMFIGVVPAARGRGLGSALIEPMLARADAEGIPVYLDSTNERNLSFYRRHGFDVTASGRVGTDGPMVWAMLRRPID